jgi:hypothetical protein
LSLKQAVNYKYLKQFSRRLFSPGFSWPALKRMIKVEPFPATRKRCFPLLKQRDPTKLRGEICGFSRSHADSLAPEVLLSFPHQRRVAPYLARFSRDPGFPVRGTKRGHECGFH